MRVTDITPQKRDTGRFNVFIDGAYIFALVPQDIAYFKLKEGQEVSAETVAFIQKNLIYIKAQETALHYIGYKMRTVKEVTQKLREKEFSESTIVQVLEFLQKYKYTDDEEYALRYIRQRQRLNPRSAYLLRLELMERGVGEDICRRVLAETPPQEAEDAFVWLEKKARGVWPLDEKKKKQVVGFLQRKGYSYDIIKTAFRHKDEEQQGGE